jgi:hypothetical protein
LRSVNLIAESNPFSSFLHASQLLQPYILSFFLSSTFKFFFPSYSHQPLLPPKPNLAIFEILIRYIPSINSTISQSHHQEGREGIFPLWGKGGVGRGLGYVIVKERQGKEGRRLTDMSTRSKRNVQVGGLWGMIINKQKVKKFWGKKGGFY